jgi:hypothetical protein
VAREERPLRAQDDCAVRGRLGAVRSTSAGFTAGVNRSSVPADGVEGRQVTMRGST